MGLSLQGTHSNIKNKGMPPNDLGRQQISQIMKVPAMRQAYTVSSGSLTARGRGAFVSVPGHQAAFPLSHP